MQFKGMSVFSYFIQLFYSVILFSYFILSSFCRSKQFIGGSESKKNDSKFFFGGKFSWN